MNFVYYSLVLFSEQTKHEKQWLRSITSLRRFNKTIPVSLFVFNEPTKAMLELADRYEVTVHQPGSYCACLRAAGGEAAAALSTIPTLHKLLPLEYIPANVSQVLFLDCDTFFFGDVASLFTKYGQCQWYAREEPSSRRSPFVPYSPLHVDEDTLYRIASTTGAAPVPPYNSGVFLLNHGVWAPLFSLRKEFFSYAWRLTQAAGLSPAIDLTPELKQKISDLCTVLHEAPIEFPSKNFWILEQIALWLTLGKLPGLSHGQFRMEDVLQNGEFMIYRSYKSKCTLVHYFGGNEALFLKDSGEQDGLPPSSGAAY